MICYFEPVMSAPMEKQLAPRFPFLLRFFPSLSDFAFVAPLAVQFGLAGGAHGLLADGDTGWHIRSGEWILENGRIPHQDMFSFTKAGQPWFAWEWLWDLSMGFLHRHGGLPAIVLANSLFLCLLFLTLYRVTRSRCGNDYIAIAGTLLAVLYTSTYWLARPHLVTLLMVLLFQHVLERAQEGHGRLLWILPPLTALWANMHGGFLAGILLAGLYAIGELLPIITGASLTAALGRSKTYLLTAAACLVASLVNPYGAQLHFHIFRYLTNPFFPKYISEFQALSFQEPASRFLEALVLLGAVATVRSLRRREFIHPLIFLVWLHLAVTSARHSPIFVVLITPWICSELSGLLGDMEGARIHSKVKAALASFSTSAAEFSRIDRIERFYVTPLLALLFVAAALYSPAPGPKFRAEFDPRNFPAAAAANLNVREEAGRLFSTDLWGGYLIYRLYPSLRVFIDGRSDFYGPAFVKEYLDLLSAQPGWEEGLERYHVSRVLIPFYTPLGAVLKESKHWRIVSDDGVAILYAKNR